MKIIGNTKVCAVIGDPIDHSFSPIIQNAAFHALQLNYVYVAFRVSEENLKSSIEGIRVLNIRGFNVTMPLKSAIIPYLDQLDCHAQKIGAVNTVLNKNNKLIGYNTDGVGALSALEENHQSLTNKKVLILGAGGASRAISFSFAEYAYKLEILNRTIEKAKKIAEEINSLYPRKVKYGSLENLTEATKTVDIIVNATSLGMYPKEVENPIPLDLLRPDHTVFDLVYHPIKTKLLSEAKKVGAKTINGLDLLLHQGSLSFKIWTGKQAPISVMRKAFMEHLRKES